MFYKNSIKQNRHDITTVLLNKKKTYFLRMQKRMSGTSVCQCITFYKKGAIKSK